MRRSIPLFVFGSINQDITFAVPEFPAPGQTLMATGTRSAIGGKGANQAIAAALSGAPTQMVGAVGQDGGGEKALDVLRRAGVGVRHVREHADVPTGMAYICVRTDGENTIVVAPGANSALQAEGLADQGIYSEEGAWCLLSLEVLEAEAFAFAARAKEAGMKVALNASPGLEGELPPGLIDLLIVNEVEASAVVDSVAGDMEGNLAEGLGIPAVVVTQGGDGVHIHTPGRERACVPAIPITVVDTTGCGDAFAGVLMSKLCAGESLAVSVETAVRYSGHVASFHGASESYFIAFKKASRVGSR